MIGKLKTEKYGSKILEEIAKYTETEQPENVPPDDSTLGEGQGSEKKPTKRLKTDEAQGSEKKPTKRLKTDEGQGSENRAPKRLKSNKAVVLIESSGDETWQNLKQTDDSDIGRPSINLLNSQKMRKHSLWKSNGRYAFLI